MSQQLPAPFVVGDEWWQQLVSYGLGRKWDSEYLAPFYANEQQQQGMSEMGQVYRPGSVLPAGVSPVVVGLGALVVVGLMVWAVKS